MTDDGGAGAGPLTVVGGRVVTPDRPVAERSVHVRDGTIEHIGSLGGGAAGTTIDATGRYVIPGLVDLHGDDIELQLSPKPDATVDPALALVVCDRLNVASGVTTKFHALAFERDPAEERSIELAMDVVETVERATNLLGQNKVHARCELAEEDAVTAVSRVLDRQATDLVSLMSHVPGRGQFDTYDDFVREYVPPGRGDTVRAGAVAQARRSADPTELHERAESVIDAAAARDVPVAAHDVEDPRRVDELVGMGVDVFEYPTALPAVRRANDHCRPVAMGAPNLVRGGSLWGNLSVQEAIETATVDVLCSDFHPPSLLQSLFTDTAEPLPRRIARVSTAPAEAVGLTNRGRIEPGYRADLVVVDPGEPPVVERVIVGGAEVYRAESSTGGG